MKQILFGMLALLLVLSVVSIVSMTEATSYRNIVNVKFYGKAACIAQKTNEVYWRISSNEKDPATGEHKQLIARGELENLGNYLKNLEAHGKPLFVTFTSTFDLQYWQAKYHTILKVLREYIELYKPGTHIEIFDDYKYQTFDKSRSQYTWNHYVNLGC
jgi:hypothetical protein